MAKDSEQLSQESKAARAEGEQSNEKADKLEQASKDTKRAEDSQKKAEE